MRPTSPSSVAENSSVWRASGVSRTIRSTAGLKPMSSIRSASSRTSASIWSRRTARRSSRSISRPGVATMMSARLDRLDLRRDGDAAVDGDDVDRAGAGDRRRARRRSGWPAHGSARGSGPTGRPPASTRSTSGTPKASVLPDPVGRLDEHVALGEHVADDHGLDGEGGSGCRARRVRAPRVRTRRDRRRTAWTAWKLLCRAVRLQSPESVLQEQPKPRGGECRSTEDPSRSRLRSRDARAYGGRPRSARPLADAGVAARCGRPAAPPRRSPRRRARCSRRLHPRLRRR